MDTTTGKLDLETSPQRNREREWQRNGCGVAWTLFSESAHHAAPRSKVPETGSQALSNRRQKRQRINHRRWRRCFLVFLLVTAAGILNANTTAQEQVWVTTDRSDYPPGATALIRGAGFLPHEPVGLQVLHTDHIPNTGRGHDPWTAPADAEGTVNTTWHVNPDDSANSGFRLTARGLTSSRKAHVEFTDSVTVTPASGGTNIPADKAQNAVTPAWTALGNIVIQENSSNDFSSGSGVTLILTAPDGWRFRAGHGSVSHQNGPNISSSAITVGATTLTITLTVSGVNKSDKLTISGIQVQATDGRSLPASGAIVRSAANPGTAQIVGIINNTTVFGELSQAPGVATALAFDTEPGAAMAGAIFGIQPIIKAKDQFGNNTASGLGSILNVTVSLSSGVDPLQGTASRNIGTSGGNGTVTYTDLRIDTAGTDKQLTASATGLTSALSAIFAVSCAPASTLVFVVQPGSVAYGSLLTPVPVVKTRDAYGNDSTVGLAASKLVTVALSAGSGTLLGTLVRDIGTNAGNGSVEFADLAVNAAGENKQLSAAAPGLATAFSAPFAIYPLPVAAAITALDKVYDGTTVAMISGYTIYGVIGNDEVGLSVGTANFDDKHVGIQKYVTATGLNLTGPDAGNYVLATPSAQTTASISARPLTVTALGQNKVYDGTTAATVTLADDRIAGDSLQTGYITAAFADKQAGTGKPIFVSGITLSGEDAANYVLANTSAATVGDIVPMEVTVTGVRANDKVYDGTLNTAVDAGAPSLSE